MTAAAKGPGSDDASSLATQWFIVSDLGLTAFSGNDGIHVFVNSLASTDAVTKAEVRLVARNNEILATRKTDETGHVLFEAGLARGEVTETTTQGERAPMAATAESVLKPDFKTIADFRPRLRGTLLINTSPSWPHHPSNGGRSRCDIATDMC